MNAREEAIEVMFAALDSAVTFDSTDDTKRARSVTGLMLDAALASGVVVLRDDLERLGYFFAHDEPSKFEAVDGREFALLGMVFDSPGQRRPERYVPVFVLRGED